MDLITGLSAASQAVGLAKQLRDLDRAIDDAGYKAKLIELHEKVLDARTSLLEAREAILEKDARISDLEKSLAELKSGEPCPICHQGVLQVTASRAHPQFGVFGHQERTLTCTNAECGHSEKRRHDPSKKT